MVEQITTGFVLIGALVGIGLGLYGLAPTVFRRRLRKLRDRLAVESGEGETEFCDDDEYVDEDNLSGAYGFLVDSRRRSRSLFGLPSAWRDAPAVAMAVEADTADEPLVDPLLLVAAAEPPLRPTLRAAWLEPAPEAARSNAPEAPQVDPASEGQDANDQMLDIFREVLPDNRTFAGKARANAVDSARLTDVPIRDLLADARWTAMSILRGRQEVPAK
jgi:hypothetical protein